MATDVPRQLAIFDVDGTLTHTTEIDAACFVRALALEIGITPPHTDWGGYLHTTDPGITREIFQARFDRPPSVEELARLERRFVDLLVEAIDQHRPALTEVPGATALLARLRSGGEWDVAIATGAWKTSALLKLGRAGIDVSGLPAAFAEDGEGREEIVRAAWARAEAARVDDGRAPVDGGTSESAPHGVGAGRAIYTRVVSIGDAIWDVRTAHRLGLPFLGVASNEAEGALRAAGATHIVRDFRDVVAVVHALAEAGVPHAEGAR